MNRRQLKRYVVEPICKYLNMYSNEAVDLLLGTAAQESHMGEYIVQLQGGPACGIFQIEPNTAQDVFDNYLKYRPDLRSAVESLMIPSMDLRENLITNLAFQVAMARIIYYRAPARIPKTLEGQAEYWKKYYNTHLGKGTVEEYKHNYERFIL